ncbi:MAG: hypothetical protein WD688_08250 [Candidatus Binatia bacterium]
MRKRVVTVSPDTQIKEAARLMALEVRDDALLVKISFMLLDAKESEIAWLKDAIREYWE